MPEFENNILQYLHSNVSLDNVSGLNEFGIAFEECINNLIAEGYVKDLRNRTRPDDKAQYLGLYVLTKKGVLYLESNRLLEQKKLIEDTQNKEHDYRVAKYSALYGSISGAILGLITSLIFWLLQ